MPADGVEPGSPSRWLAYARSDLLLAGREPEPGVFLESLCFHAQQAAEKSIKAVLLHRGIRFPRTHNIEVLLGLLPGDCPRPPDEEGVSELTEYAVEARYPDDSEGATSAQYRRAVDAAGAVVEWAERLVERQE